MVLEVFGFTNSQRRVPPAAPPSRTRTELTGIKNPKVATRLGQTAKVRRFVFPSLPGYTAEGAGAPPREMRCVFTVAALGVEHAAVFVQDFLPGRWRIFNSVSMWLLINPDAPQGIRIGSKN